MTTMKHIKYNQYKNSNIYWVGDIPSHWEKIPVKHHFFSKKQVAGILADDYQRLALTLNGVIKRSKEDAEGLQPEKFETYQIVRKNSLIFKLIDLENIKTSRVGLSKYDGLVSPAYITLSSNGDILPAYAENYFLNMWYEHIFNQLGSVGVRSNLNKEDLLNLPIIKPPLEEQELISNYLNKQTTKINEIIAKNEKLIHLLKEKKVSLINQIVTKGLNPDVPMKYSGIEIIGEIPKHWEVEKIKNISQVKPSNIDKKSKENEPPVLLCNYTDVYNNEFITMDIDFMKATTTPDQIKKLSLDVGDIIITKDSESADDIAVPAIVTENLENVVCGYHLAVIKPDTNIINPKFLFRLFESDRINKQFELGANGVTRFGLGSYPINNAYICKPPLNEQGEIVQYLDIETSKIAKATDKILKHIELLEEYKSSLIHHVVTGKIDVREEVI